MLVLCHTTFLGTLIDEQLATHQQLLCNIFIHGVIWYFDMSLNEFIIKYTCVFLSVLCVSPEDSVMLHRNMLRVL
jgi:hypothetical protein